MKAFLANGVVLMCFGVFLALTTLFITLPRPRTTAAGEFTCNLEGELKVRIPAVTRARLLDGGEWRVEVPDGFYLYLPHPGELCGVIRLPADRLASS